MIVVHDDDPDSPVPELGSGRPNLDILILVMLCTARPYGAATPKRGGMPRITPKTVFSGSLVLVRDVHADLVEVHHHES